MIRYVLAISMFLFLVGTNAEAQGLNAGSCVKPHIGTTIKTGSDAIVMVNNCINEGIKASCQGCGSGCSTAVTKACEAQIKEFCAFSRSTSNCIHFTVGPVDGPLPRPPKNGVTEGVTETGSDTCPEFDRDENGLCPGQAPSAGVGPRPRPGGSASSTPRGQAKTPSSPTAPPSSVGHEASTETPADSPSSSGTSSTGTGQYARLCVEAGVSADACCYNPLSCLGVSGSAQDGLNGYAAHMAQSAGSGGIEKACSTMKNAGYTSQSVNGASAAVCYESKSSCLSVCTDNAVQIKAQLQSQCGFNPDSHNTSSLSGECRTLYNAYTTVGEQLITCRTLSENVAALKTQSNSGNQAAQLAQFCQSQSQTTPAETGFEQNPQVLSQSGYDCSKSEYQNDPRCRDCTKPSMANNPLCRSAQTATPADGNLVNAAGSQPNFGTRASEFNTGDSRSNTNQGAPLDEAQKLQQQQASSSSGIPNGGGGGAMGGDSGGGAGLRARAHAAGSPGGGGGYNTDVLREASGGGGANFAKGASSAGTLAEASTGGGFRYGGDDEGRDPASDSGMLDLKQYLPGGKRDPTRRLAGVAGRAADPSLEGTTMNLLLWERMTFRFKVICKMKGLDCSTDPAHSVSRPVRNR